MAETLISLRRISLTGTIWTLILAGLLSLIAATPPVWPLAALATIDALLTIVAAVAVAVVLARMLRGTMALFLLLLLASVVLAGLPFADVDWSSYLALGILVAASVTVIVGRGGSMEQMHLLLAAGVTVLTLATGVMQGAGGDVPERLAIMGVLMAAAVVAALLFGSLGRRPARPAN